MAGGADTGARTFQDRLLSAFKSEREIFEREVQGISPAGIDELVGGLRERAVDADRLLEYSRMLFASERTRELGLLLCVQLLQYGELSDRATFRCMPEMRAAIMDACSSTDAMDTGEGTGTGLLSRLCQSLVGFLCVHGAAGPGAELLKGHAQALELLSTALQVLENISHTRTNTFTDAQGELGPGDWAGEVRTATLGSVLKAAWPAQLVLPLELVLADVQLTDEEQEQACAHMIPGAASPAASLPAVLAFAPPQEHCIGLIQCALTMAEKSGLACWLDAARGVLEATPEHLLGDAYCVVEMSLQSGSRLMGLLLLTFRAFGTREQPKNQTTLARTSEKASSNSEKASKANKAGSASKKIQRAVQPAGVADVAVQQHATLKVSDFNLMLVVAQNDLFRDVVMDLMIAALLRLSDDSAVEQPGQTHAHRQATNLINDVVKGREGGRYSSVMLELGLCLLLHGSSSLSPSTHKHSNESVSVQRHSKSGFSHHVLLGQHMLCELFRWQPHTRSEILSTLFDALVEHIHAHRFLSSCTQVLQKIASSHLASLREETCTLVQCLSLLWLLPLATARTLLTAFLPISRHSAQLCDRLMVLFRKELYGASTQRRCLAVYGLCSMLSTGLLHEDAQQLDALVSLKPLLAADSDVRAELYEGIQSLLCARDTRGTCTSVAVTCAQAQGLLKELLMSRVRRYLVEPDVDASKGKAAPGEGLELRLEACFEVVCSGVNAKQWRCKESLARLFRSVSAMAADDRQAASILLSLSKQLTCPESVASLLTGNKCAQNTSEPLQNDKKRGSEPLQTDTGKMPDIDALQRLQVVLPLYDLFLEETTSAVPSAWAIRTHTNARARARSHMDSWLCICSAVCSLVPAQNTRSLAEAAHSHGEVEKALIVLEKVSSRPHAHTHTNTDFAVCGGPKNVSSKEPVNGQCNGAGSSSNSNGAGSSSNSNGAGSSSNFNGAGSSSNSNGAGSSSNSNGAGSSSNSNGAGSNSNSNGAESDGSGSSIANGAVNSETDIIARKHCLQLAPVICRLLDRVLLHAVQHDSMHQNTNADPNAKEAGASSSTHRPPSSTSCLSGAGGVQSAPFAKRFLQCVVRIFSLTHPGHDDGRPRTHTHVRSEGPTTRSARASSLSSGGRPPETDVDDASPSCGFVSILGEHALPGKRSRGGRGGGGDAGQDQGRQKVAPRRGGAGPEGRSTEVCGAAGGGDQGGAPGARVLLDACASLPSCEVGGLNGAVGSDSCDEAGGNCGARTTEGSNGTLNVAVDIGSSNRIGDAHAPHMHVAGEVGAGGANTHTLAGNGGDGASEEGVNDFAEELDECLRKSSCALKFGSGGTFYHKLRYLLLDAMRTCLTHGCSSQMLRDALTNNSNNSNDADNNSSACARALRRDVAEDDGDQSRRTGRAEGAAGTCVDLLCDALGKEAEEGVPLATLTAYLDLISAVLDAEGRKGGSVLGDGANPSRGGNPGKEAGEEGAWVDVCKRLFDMLRSFDIGHPQVLQRTLTLSCKALPSLHAAALAAQVLAQAAAAVSRESTDKSRDSMDDKDDDTSISVQPVNNPLAHLLPTQAAWGLPDLDSAPTRGCAMRVSLRELSDFFGRVIPLDEHAHVSVALHGAAAVADTCRVAADVSVSARALLMRVCRRILGQTCDALTCLLRGGQQQHHKSVVQCVLQLAQQALIAAHCLCDAVPTEKETGAVGAANVRHAAFKCSLQVAAYIATVPRGGRLGVLVQELEEHVKALQSGAAADEVVIQDVWVEKGGGGKRRAGGRKRRLRSRNAYVDAGLEEEDGDDDYGDLEDFIVCKEGKRY